MNASEEKLRTKIGGLWLIIQRKIAKDNIEKIGSISQQHYFDDAIRKELKKRSNLFAIWLSPSTQNRWVPLTTHRQRTRGRLCSVVTSLKCQTYGTPEAIELRLICSKAQAKARKRKFDIDEYQCRKRMIKFQ